MNSISPISPVHPMDLQQLIHHLPKPFQYLASSVFPYNCFVTKRSHTMKTRSALRYERPRPKCMPARSKLVARRIGKIWSCRSRYGGPIGLQNPRYFCYRRSLLQCLLHSSVFHNYLGNTHCKCDKADTECVPCALQVLMQQYWQARTGNFPQRNRKGAVGDFDAAVAFACASPAHRFQEFVTPNFQGDPMEMLDVIVEQLRSVEHSR